MEYYFDMDGVIVKYERAAYVGDNPLYLREQAHYFRDLHPDQKMIAVLHEYCQRKDCNVFVLTSVPNVGKLYLEHTQDKIEWLHKHCPFIDTDKQFISTISPKHNIVELLRSKQLSRHDLLIDDYNLNMNKWIEAGGSAIKYINGINTSDSFSGCNLTLDMDATEIINTIDSISEMIKKQYKE